MYCAALVAQPLVTAQSTLAMGTISNPGVLNIHSRRAHSLLYPSISTPLPSKTLPTNRGSRSTCGCIPATPDPRGHRISEALQREERRRIRLGAWARMCLALAPDLEDTRSDGSSDDEEFLATLFAPRCARCGFRVFYPSSPETLPARCPAGHAEFEVYIERKRVQIS